MFNQMIFRMDDFEKEYPDFDWKNTPANIQAVEIVHVQNMNTSENKSISQNKSMKKAKSLPKLH